MAQENQAAGTYIEYGQIRLYRVVTHEFRQEQVWDDSRTDLLYSKFTVRVSGFLHGHNDWSYYHQAPAASDGKADLAHKGVRYQLPPRLPFRMVVGALANDTPGDVLLEANPAPLNMTPPPSASANINLYNTDLNNGPRCLEFAVTSITGNEVYAVDATFEICKLECNPDGTCPFNTYGVLSNRWSVTESIDHNMRSSRTYSGTAVFASANINAMMLRWIVAPPLQPLFRRDRMEFAVSEDGLKLRWSVTDVEIALSAPYPARKWSYVHTVGTRSIEYAPCTIDVSLEADSSVNKADLIELALYIICFKMFGRTPSMLNPAASQYIVNEIRLVDHGGDINMITASASVSKKTDKIEGFFTGAAQLGQLIPPTNLPAPNNGEQGGLGASAIKDNLGNVIGYQDTGGNQLYDSALSWGGYAGQVPAVEGPAQVVGIFACFLQNPCNNNHQIRRPGQSLGSRNMGVTDGASSQTQVPYTARVQAGLTTSQNSLYSSSHEAAIYQTWKIDNIYRRKSMRVQMPIAGAQLTPYGPATASAKLANDQARRILRADATRIGAWPEFFDPENIPPWPVPDSVPPGYSPPQQWYLDHTLRPGTITTTATGQLVYSATMEIVIGLSRAPTPNEKLALGNNKWMSLGSLSTTPTLTNSRW
jgi:hypothetical protein